MNSRESNQAQTAGDKSTQMQFGDNTNVLILSDHVEEFLQNLPMQYNPEEIKSEIYQEVNQRINNLNHEVSERFEKIEDSIKSIKDPKFVYLYQQARDTAIKTERIADYEQLAELLAMHVNNEKEGNNKIIYDSISRAVSIVNRIDNNALCALTLVFFIRGLIPSSGDITEGLGDLNRFYKKLLYTDLPNDSRWINHLITLDIIKQSEAFENQMRTFENLCSRHYNGYCCIGIEEGSENHRLAKELLDKSSDECNKFILIPNELMNGAGSENESSSHYLRLNVSSLTEVPIDLHPIINFYSKDERLFDIINNNFSELINSFDSLKIISQWYNSTNTAFEITDVGKVLVQTNAKRIFDDFPDLVS